MLTKSFILLNYIQLCDHVRENSIARETNDPRIIALAVRWKSLVFYEHMPFSSIPLLLGLYTIHCNTMMIVFFPSIFFQRP